MLKRTCFLSLLFCALIFSYMKSEDVKSSETVASVKELMDFHEVIYQVWHDAWPNKNVKLLRDLLPEIKDGVEKVSNAKLPGILREKQKKWAEGIKELNSIYGNYKIAAEKGDSSALLSEAEKLHSQFEKLVRTIKPMMKELEAYHVELYKLYHYYMPDYNYDKIQIAVGELYIKMEALLKAQIPKRISQKSEKFETARNDLNSALKELTETVKAGNNKDNITKAIEKMHTCYQKLEAVFD